VSEKTTQLPLSHLSLAALLALKKGEVANCPGCCFERQVPHRTRDGIAVHDHDRLKPYECYAWDAWRCVPEFEG